MDRRRIVRSLAAVSLCAVTVISGCRTAPVADSGPAILPPNPSGDVAAAENGEAALNDVSPSVARRDPPADSPVSAAEAVHSPSLLLLDDIDRLEQPDGKQVERAALIAPAAPPPPALPRLAPLRAESAVAEAAAAASAPGVSESHGRSSARPVTDGGSVFSPGTLAGTVSVPVKETQPGGLPEPTPPDVVRTDAGETSPLAQTARDQPEPVQPFANARISAAAPGEPISVVRTSTEAEPAGPAAVAPFGEQAGRVAVVQPNVQSRTSDPGEWLQQRVELDPDTEVEIILPGYGWLYVGREYGSGTADLIGKTSENGQDRFAFRFSREGEYGLWFQRQDGDSGNVVNERLQVAVRAEGDAGASGIPQRDNDLPQRGEAPADGIDYGAIAAEAEADGDFMRAGELWAMVIAEGGTGVDEAARRLYSIGEDLGNAPFLRTATEALERSGELTDDMVMAAASSLEGSSPADSARFYDRLISRAGAGEQLDAVYFRLAKLLEAPGPNRDIGRARELYERIVTAYPLSLYWDESSKRAMYIRRHFFDIR